jgi:hypothetical protein
MGSGGKLLMSDRSRYYSILRGTDAIIDDFFGVKKTEGPPQYGTRTTYLTLEPKSLTCDASAMLFNIHDRIAANWRERTYRKVASEQNWRCERRLAYNEHRKGCEVRLEREIVRAMGSPPWYNAVPTSSGLCSPTHDKARNIDLAYSGCPDEYTFYELKWNANIPVFAAVEIIRYGLLNVFSRLTREKMGYLADHSPMLTAHRVHLRVLGCSKYFHEDNVNLGWLESKLNDGLRHYGTQFASEAGVKLDFAFESFSDDLARAFAPEAIRQALSQRRVAYPH